MYQYGTAENFVCTSITIGFSSINLNPYGLEGITILRDATVVKAYEVRTKFPIFCCQVSFPLGQRAWTRLCLKQQLSESIQHNTITNLLDIRCMHGLVLLDFSKTFDTMHHIHCRKMLDEFYFSASATWLMTNYSIVAPIVSFWMLWMSPKIQ